MTQAVAEELLRQCSEGLTFVGFMASARVEVDAPSAERAASLLREAVRSLLSARESLGQEAVKNFSELGEIVFTLGSGLLEESELSPPHRLSTEFGLASIDILANFAPPPPPIPPLPPIPPPYEPPKDFTAPKKLIEVLERLIEFLEKLAKDAKASGKDGQALREALRELRAALESIRSGRPFNLRAFLRYLGRPLQSFLNTILRYLSGSQRAALVQRLRELASGLARLIPGTGGGAAAGGGIASLLGTILLILGAFLVGALIGYRLGKVKLANGMTLHEFLGEGLYLEYFGGKKADTCDAFFDEIIRAETEVREAKARNASNADLRSAEARAIRAYSRYLARKCPDPSGALQKALDAHLKRLQELLR